MITSVEQIKQLAIQEVGRTSRQKNFKIYNIEPYNRIPFYSKDYNERMTLIKNYYRDCKINELKLNENEL